MAKEYRGAYERGVDRMIADQVQEIEINWINMSAKESGRGGADRITRKLIAAGYRPSGCDVPDKHREAYEAGRKVNGQYIRPPQETWTRRADLEATG